RERGEPRTQFCAHARIAGHVAGAGGELSTSLEVRKDQRADLVASGAGNDDVARVRLELRQQASTQRSDIHPGAGAQLEVLGHAAVEQESRARIAGVFEFERIAELVEAVFIEGLRGELALAPIARRDVRAAQPRLELALGRN